MHWLVLVGLLLYYVWTIAENEGRRKGSEDPLSWNDKLDIMGKHLSGNDEEAEALRKKLLKEKFGLEEGAEKLINSPYIGSLSGNTFHLPDKSCSQNIWPENLIRFESRADAIDNGYMPCLRCKP